jgi:hypothetical protein
MTFAVEEARQILSQDARGRVLQAAPLRVFRRSTVFQQQTVPIWMRTTLYRASNSFC